MLPPRNCVLYYYHPFIWWELFFQKNKKMRSLYFFSNLVSQCISGEWLWTSALPWWGSGGFGHGCFQFSGDTFFFLVGSLMPRHLTQVQVSFSWETCVYWQSPLFLLSDLCPVYFIRITTLYKSLVSKRS